MWLNAPQTLIHLVPSGCVRLRSEIHPAGVVAGARLRPDAVAVDPQGNRIAIEIERHVKTLKRYEAVFAIYLQSIKRGEYAAVHYICPDERLARQLVRPNTLTSCRASRSSGQI